MNSKPIIASVALFSFTLGHSQQTVFYNQHEDYRFSLAENLYNSKIYNASQYEFARQFFYNKNLSQSKKEAARFFDNIISLILQKNHSEDVLEAFVAQYSNSAYFTKANLPLADYYLAKKDFPKALDYLKKVNQYQLSQKDNVDYVLKLGYAKFMQGDSNGAIEALQEAYNNTNDEQKDKISYMLGHLYYANKDTDKAFELFSNLKDKKEWSSLVRPYYVQMFFNEKDYDKAIAEGNALLNENSSNSYKTEVHKIIGESYFMKKDYVSAFPHLKIYIDEQQNPSDSDLYEMGFVSAQLNKFDEAVSYYNRLINSNSAMSQNAYYQLGNAYLQTAKKQEALSAFRSAYQMNYDEKVQQLAHEQYAKLSYELGNPFENAPNVIQNYLKKYPNSPNSSEMRKLLVKSYLYSGNYKETLSALDELKNTSPETDKISQEVSFLLGTEEYNKSKWDSAEQYFLRSLAINQNKEIYNRALYWLGQTYYQKNNYKSAIEKYIKLLNEDFPEKQQLTYDLAYAYFKLNQLDKAQEYFKTYLQNPKNEFKSDAELRLADTYYAQNKLNDAIEIYDKSEDFQDYTVFQKAMALGFKGDTEAKINNLKSLIAKYPNSDYTDDALYEIGSAYAAQDNFLTSNEYFTKVIKTSSDKDLVANASLYKIQNYTDLNENDKAISELKQLAETYKNTNYASKLMQTAKNAYLKNNDIAGYQSFAQNLGVDLEPSELNEINLNTAENFFTKKDYKNAIPYYEKYLKQNPKGEALYQAQYELGESFYQNKESVKSLLVFQKVASVQNDYQEDAQTRMAQIYLSQNKNEDAKKYLEKLLFSSNTSIKNFANTELMKIYANEKNYEKAQQYADILLANTKNSVSVLETAKVIKARSLMNSGKDKEAQNAYSALEKSSNSEVAAEAVYTKAFYQNKAKAFKTSNETIFKLANNYASEAYWGAKSLLVMAKNYIGLKDNYQASYTLDQIIANYKDFPEIITEAKQIKQKIK